MLVVAKEQTLRTAWVTIVNVGLGVWLVLLLFSAWTGVPRVEKALVEFAQVSVAMSLLVGAFLQIRRSKKGRTWNVTTQSLAASFPWAAYVWALHRANKSGQPIDGIEIVLVWIGVWTLMISGVTWFLYSRTTTVASPNAP